MQGLERVMFDSRFVNRRRNKSGVDVSLSLFSLQFTNEPRVRPVLHFRTILENFRDVEEHTATVVPTKVDTPSSQRTTLVFEIEANTLVSHLYAPTVFISRDDVGGLKRFIDDRRDHIRLIVIRRHLFGLLNEAAPSVLTPRAVLSRLRNIMIATSHVPFVIVRHVAYVVPREFQASKEAP